MERGELTRALRASARTRPSPRPTSTTPCSLLDGPRAPGRAGHLPAPRPRSWPTWCCRPRPSWCEAEGTVTNSERRVQRVRKALEPPGQRARRHRDHLELAAPARARLGRPDGRGGLERAALARARARRHELRAARGARRPPVAVLRRGPSRASRSCTAGSGRSRSRARRRRSTPVEHDAAGRELLDEEFPLRLTTGRRLDSYNTGVQTGGYTSPLRRGETLDLSPEDAAELRRRRRRARAGRLAARRGRRAGAHRPRRCGRASRS